MRSRSTGRWECGEDSRLKGPGGPEPLSVVVRYRPPSYWLSLITHSLAYARVIASHQVPSVQEGSLPALPSKLVAHLRREVREILSGWCFAQELAYFIARGLKSDRGMPVGAPSHLDLVEAAHKVRAALLAGTQEGARLRIQSIPRTLAPEEKDV